jgi:hypothetical protein
MPSPDQNFNTLNTAESLGYAGNTANGKLANVRQIWQKGALMGEQNTDFFQQMESLSESGVIWIKNELSKGAGSIMNFTTQSGFYGKGKYGEALFEQPADFEVIKQGNFQLKIDYVRNAVRNSRRQEEMMGMLGDIDSGLNIELGNWLGRLKTEQLFALITRLLPVANQFYANGRTLDTLRTEDILDWNNIVLAGQAMKPLGGKPARMKTINGGQVWGQTFIATEPALTSLKLDDDWKRMLTVGYTKGPQNLVFSGGYPEVDGHVIAPFNAIDHDGDGPVGSFLNPYAYLDVQPADDSAAIVVKGGGAGWTTGVDYLRYFPGMPYQFVDTGLDATSDTGTYFFLIYNLTGADAGKWGMYAYRGHTTTAGNNGTQITVIGKLWSSTAGIGQQYFGGNDYTAATGAASGSTAVGAVTYDAAKHTWVHPVGSLIIPCNARGVPIGRTPILGRAGILRGYGSLRAEHTADLLNGKFITDRYITSVFGQSFRQDRKGRVPSVACLTHAITIPGISLPTVSV